MRLKRKHAGHRLQPSPQPKKNLPTASILDRVLHRSARSAHDADKSPSQGVKCAIFTPLCQFLGTRHEAACPSSINRSSETIALTRAARWSFERQKIAIPLRQFFGTRRTVVCPSPINRSSEAIVLTKVAHWSFERQKIANPSVSFLAFLLKNKELGRLDGMA